MMPLLLEAACRSALLGLIVLAALRLFRVRQPQVETTFWVAVLGAAVAMPLLMQITLVRLPTPAFVTTGTAPVLPVLHLVAPSAETVERIASVHRAVAFLVPVDWASLGWTCAATVYLTVAAVLLLRLGAGLLATWRIAETARPVRTLSTQGADVRMTDLVQAPVTVGRVILVPVAFVDWPAAKRRAVLAHEMAHVANHDFSIQLLAGLHAALFWFSPFAWWLKRRLVSLAEAVSDQSAIEGLGDHVAYAEILLDIAKGGRRLPAGIAMARPAMLRDRIERILAQTGAALPTPALTRHARVLLATSLVPAILLASVTGWRADAAVVAPDARPESCTGHAFALYHHGRTMVGGCADEKALLSAAHRSGDADTFAFMHDDHVYAVTNPEIVDEADEVLSANGAETQRAFADADAELAHQVADIGRREADIWRREADIGREMADATRRYAEEFARRVREARADGDAVDDLKSELDDTTAGLKEELANLREEQKELGKEQGQLGTERGKLARPKTDQYAQLSHLIDRAIESGAAHPLESTLRVWPHPLA